MICSALNICLEKGTTKSEENTYNTSIPKPVIPQFHNMQIMETV